MKKLLALIFVALCTISIEAQEKYVAIERNAETGAYTLSKEFKAVLPLNEDGTYGDVATNKDSRGSVVVMKTASVTVEAVGGSIPAQVPDVAGDNTATHVDINPDGTVNSWDDIKWQQKSLGDINWAWIQGTGNPAAKIEAEAIMTDDVPATYVDENGVEHTKYRPVYTFYNPDGSLGVPEMGLYYKVTATKNGSIKIGVWVNKGNRNTYVVDAATALPVAYKAMGYINGQNETYLQGDGTEASRKKYLTAEEIESIHKANCTDATTGEDTKPYVIGAGNQPFFGHITFKMEAGKTYYVFCESSQIGFNGWIFDKYITFADSKVKEICVANWDTNSDGELSHVEAAAVTNLAKYFSNNTEITSFNELQYFTKLTTISSSAFNGCSNLASITIPNSVTKGNGAFSGCSALTSVTVGNSTPIKLTDVSTFSNRANATLYVPAGSKAAYAAASIWNEFKEIIEIENITFADSKVKEICVAKWDTNSDGELSYAEAAAVTSLGKIFKGNTEIVSFDELQYFTGLTSINEYAFQDCSNLSSLKIPNNVTSLGLACFLGCWKLQTLTIPNSVTTLNDKIFYDCGIKSITIPQSVKSIGISLFKNCPDLTTIIVEEGNPIYDSRDNCNAIIETSSNTLIASCKNTVIPQTVTTIGEAAFLYCSGLTSIVVPNNVLSIKGAAFRDCYDLTSVTLPNTITNIDTLTFYGCHVLESIIIPRSVKSIGDRAFGRCLQLKSVVIPSSTTTISSNAFEYCSELTSVTVGNSEPISISNFTNRTNATLYVPAGSKAAYEASSIWNEFKEIIEIENITFADSKVKEICVANWDTNGDGELSYAEAAVSSIGKTFKDNKAITSFDELQYFTGVDTIKASAFSGCNSLVSVTLPNTVKEIQQNAFYSTSLESIKIPASVNTIEAAAFNSCSNIKSIVVEERNAVYDSRNNCNGIVETATNTLIVGCMNTIIPDDITSIGESVFRGNDSLKQIVIPNSVTSIGKDAFYRCSALTSVTVGNSTPVELIDGNTFSNRANATLYVPAGSKEAYEAASVWNRFKEIVPIATVTINKYGSGTYCSPYALDFTNVSGMKAYVAAGYNTTTNTVYMLSVKTAQPGEGLFIKGAPGDYTVPEIDTSSDNYLNLLVGTTKDVTVNTLSDDGKYTNYVYGLNKDTNAPAFYKYSDGSKCMAYKAYLQIPTSWLPTVSEAKTVNIVFDDEEPTGIEEFRTEKDDDDVKIYDMQGRRVTKPGKGLYIVNGKKVVFK